MKLTRRDLAKLAVALPIAGAGCQSHRRPEPKLRAFPSVARCWTNCGAYVSAADLQSGFRGFSAKSRRSRRDGVSHTKRRGAGYAWESDGKLRFEFHREPDQKPKKDYFESYELDDKVGKEASYGSFTAPPTGIHGWFWRNKSGKDIKFHLNVTGFFDSAKMYAGSSPEDLPVETQSRD